MMRTHFTGFTLLFLCWAIPVLALYTPPDYVSGNSVLVARMPEESTFWKIALIKRAKQSIELATGFTGGEMFSKVVLLLRDQLLMEPQLRVHLEVASSLLLSHDADKILESVKRQFPDRFCYQITSMALLLAEGHWQTCEHHVKLLVVDEKYVVTGGTNLYDTYCKSKVEDASIIYLDPVRSVTPRACCDMDICCVGPMVKEMRQLFFQLWSLANTGIKSSYFSLPGGPMACVDEIDQSPRMVHGVPMRMVFSGPGMRFGECTKHYAFSIQRAKQTLALMHMHMHPHTSVREELENALDRGVSARIVTNGNSQPGWSPVPRAFGFFNRSYYLPWLTFGRSTQIYEFSRDNTLYHKKVMIVDGRYSLIGSYNLGKKSHYGDYEVVLDIDSTEVASQFLEVMDKDIASSCRCSEADARAWHYSWWYRALNALQRFFIFGPLL